MKERILVVDDDKIIQELIAILLRGKEYEVYTASNGEAGLRLAEELNPDLILMDYQMPEMDGLQALREIKRRNAQMYVIILTGKGSEEVAVELMKSGASDYLPKPFRNQDLIDRVENVLRIRRIELHNQLLMQERDRLVEEIAAWNRELEQRVEEKSRELELAHAEIVQVEKLATLGHLVAGLAHEIRNPLNSINLFSQILKNFFEHDPEHADFCNKIQSEVERIDDLLVRLLAASRPTLRNLVPVSLAQIAREEMDRFLPQFSSRQICLDLRIEETPLIQGDGAELRQVFSNLISNSLQALPDHGAFTIAVKSDGQRVYIDIADNGAGIPKEHLTRIFDPFFTTRTKGTGFGLSVVLRIVKTYKGKISVDSQPGEGTTFHIVLPLAAQGAGTQ